MIADSIDKLAGKHTLFILVDASHLPASTGLLNLLEEKGFGEKTVHAEHLLPGYVLKLHRTFFLKVFTLIVFKKLCITVRLP
ncbi:hypothetical protein SAMN05216436_1375 [bacterium A37T11]|nr:hypothetical protein SAMN05216436_1375 [bacterium A37T11]